MATPALPILASDIWSPVLTTAQDVASDLPTDASSDRRKLSLGHKAIDRALDGGIDFGGISCITSEPHSDTKEVLQSLLISHLCSSRDATATIIDSSLALDLLSLYRALESTVTNSPTTPQDAKAILDRLKIMKVFDYIGLSEAMGEVREELESKEAGRNQATTFLKSTIRDSEDEDEDEMLDDPNPRRAPALAKSRETFSNKAEPELLIINDISKVMTSPIKNNYTTGQATLAAFMRSLRHVTKKHDLCTVLFSNASTKPASEQDTLSLFASCTIRPALGPSWCHLLDVQLYLHQIPYQRTKTVEKDTAPEVVNVLEVVQDTTGTRYGRWAPFVCTEDGRMGDAP